jgi:hypothetical protein
MFHSQNCHALSMECPAIEWSYISRCETARRLTPDGASIFGAESQSGRLRRVRPPEPVLGLGPMCSAPASPMATILGYSHEIRPSAIGHSFTGRVGGASFSYWPIVAGRGEGPGTLRVRSAGQRSTSIGRRPDSWRQARSEIVQTPPVAKAVPKTSSRGNAAISCS